MSSPSLPSPSQFLLILLILLSPSIIPKYPSSHSAPPRIHHSEKSHILSPNAPLNALSGIFSSLLASATVTCPPGFYFFATTQACSICPIGSYCPGNNTRIECSGSAYQDLPQQEACKQCTAGSYTPNNVVCIPCRMHEYCPNGVDRIACTSPGQYLDEENAVCMACPEGHFCSYGKKYECPAGHYVLNVDVNAETLCLECPVGWYCPGNGTKFQCINNEYAPLPGQTECRICSEGWFTGNTSVSCLQCSQNDYCPNGIFKTRCEAGTYFSPGSASCLDCDSGFYCIDAKRYACSPGTFSNGSRKAFCEECPAGTLLPTSRGEFLDDCVPCAPGTYSPRIANSGSSCTPCPKGTWGSETGASNLNQCNKCPGGYYQDQEGQTSADSCRICPAGTIAPTVGSISCTQCDKGTYSPAAGSTSCEDCRPGSYANMTGSSSCHLCLPGTYNPSTGSQTEGDCIQCVNGGSAEYGANSSATCNDCSPGYYLVGSSCVLCPQGSYSDSPAALTCELCPTGTYLPSEGATSLLQCATCSPGSYADVRGQQKCTLCPAGTFSTVTGATNASVCEPCPAGYSADAGSFSCFACPAGTYAPVEQTPACIPCPIGSFSNSTNSTSCYECAPGSYVDAEFSTVCKLCVAGTYNPHPASISVQNCTLCPKGKYSSTVSATSILHCKECEAGTFCDEEGMNEPKKCPKGTYSTAIASESIFSCAKCPKGTYSSKEGAASLLECESCPIGRYGEKEGAVFLQECTWCDPGHYSTTSRATGPSVCIKCEPGYYSPLASSSCIACPDGTYNPNEGSANVTDCVACPNGQTTNKYPAVSKDDCERCEDGEYLSASMKCTSCEAGTYFDTNAPSTVSSACTPCGKGYEQPLITQIGRDSCSPCPVGTYAPLERNARCTPCGKGFYSNETAATNITACIPCPAGTWGDRDTANLLEHCLLCSPGTYSNVTGASSSHTCKLCPVGWKSTDPGSSECVPCDELDGCFTQGNSFELSSKQSLQESLSIFDPKSLNGLVDSSYLTLKLSIPFGVFGFFLLCSSVLLCFFLILFRCRYKKLLRKLDLFFPMKHYVRIGSSQINKPSALGGVLSIMVLVAFLGFLASILMDFISNNTIVLENFLLENSESVSGKFTFETIIVGMHKTCDSRITLIGFSVGESQVTCESGIFTQDNLAGCNCSMTCVNCAPTGNSHQILFHFQDYLMTPKIIYSIQVPHYVPNQRYMVNGSMNSGNSIFSGSDLPHTFSFSLNNARYVAISSMAAVIEVLGINQETVTRGYTIQMTGKFPGSSQPNDDNFVLSDGLQILFDIQQSFGTYVSKETVRQNLFTFFAQVLTILSMLTTIGAIVLSFLEKRKDSFEILLGWKEKPDLSDVYSDDKRRRRRKQKLDDDDSWYTPKKETSVTSEESSQPKQAGEEMPRSIEPFFLQKWREQRKKKSRIFTGDDAPIVAAGIAGLMDAVVDGMEGLDAMEGVIIPVVSPSVSQIAVEGAGFEMLPEHDEKTSQIASTIISTADEYPRAPFQQIDPHHTSVTAYTYDPREILEEMQREEATLRTLSRFSTGTSETTSNNPHSVGRFNLHQMRNSFLIDEEDTGKVPEESEFSSSNGSTTYSTTDGSSTIRYGSQRALLGHHGMNHNGMGGGDPVDDSDNDSEL